MSLPAAPTLVLSGLLLGACQSHGADPASIDDGCGAGRYQHLLGTLVSETDFSGIDDVRIIPPGTAVTLDYRPDRLNVETDAKGIITRIACG